MRKGAKFLDSVGFLLLERHHKMVFIENIYNYIQNEMSDSEFDSIVNGLEKRDKEKT